MKYGDSYYDSKEYRKAIQYYDDVTNIQPQNTDAWYNKGLAYQKLENEPEARRCFDTVQRLNPALREGFINMANKSFSERKYEDTIAYCNRALNIVPVSAEPWFIKWKAFYELDKNEDARACGDIAQKIDDSYQLKTVNYARQKLGAPPLYKNPDPKGPKYILGNEEPTTARRYPQEMLSSERVVNDTFVNPNNKYNDPTFVLPPIRPNRPTRQQNETTAYESQVQASPSSSSADSSPPPEYIYNRPSRFPNNMPVDAALDIIHRVVWGEEMNLSEADMRSIYQSLGYTGTYLKPGEMPPAASLRLTGLQAMDYEMDRVHFDANRQNNTVVTNQAPSTASRTEQLVDIMNQGPTIKELTVALQLAQKRGDDKEVQRLRTELEAAQRRQQNLASSFQSTMYSGDGTLRGITGNIR
jgi:hypothetical protein